MSRDQSKLTESAVTPTKIRVEVKPSRLKVGGFWYPNVTGTASREVENAFQQAYQDIYELRSRISKLAEAEAERATILGPSKTDIAKPANPIPPPFDGLIGRPVKDTYLAAVIVKEPLQSTNANVYNATDTPNDVLLWQFTLPFRITLSQVNLQLVTPGATIATNVSVGFYDVHGDLAITSGVFSFPAGTGAGFKTRTFNETQIDAGSYFFAYTESLANITNRLLWRANAIANTTTLLNGSGENRIGKAVNTAMAGALPASTGGVNTITGTRLFPQSIFF